MLSGLFLDSNPLANIPPTADAGSEWNVQIIAKTINITEIGTDVDGTVTAYE